MRQNEANTQKKCIMAEFVIKYLYPFDFFQNICSQIA